jgi:hypothetical protein
MSGGRPCFNAKSRAPSAARHARGKHMRFRFRRLAACALFGFAAGAFAHAAIAQSESEVSEEDAAWSYVLIKLEYADAEEIAHVLRQLLPPTVSVVAYSPTNSVLIAGDPAVLEGIEERDVEAVK